MASSTDPFAAMGGGVQYQGANGQTGWIPKSMYDQNPSQWNVVGSASGATGSTTPNGGAASTPNPVPATGAAGGPQAQAANASTYSATPGAAPPANTTNAGTADVVRNTYLAQATQSPTVSANDPLVKQQTDAFNAQMDRQKSQQINAAAEAAAAKGLGNSGALDAEKRLIGEQTGQAEGGFAAQATANAQNQRISEIQNALSSLGGLLTSDQTRALQDELAQLQNQTQLTGISTAADTAAAQQALQEKLGVGSLNLQALGQMLQNQQYNDQLGFNVGNAEAYWNNQAAQSLF